MEIYTIGLLTSGKTLTEIGLLGTISGMLIVFLTLTLIALIINLFKYFGRNDIKNVKGEHIQITKSTEDEDDLELVAVITASLAITLNTSVDDLVVKSIKRVPNNNSSWSVIGRQENLG